ncbi:MAG: transglutaminase family protein [Serpentinimonas sp.]|nr:transglutaminase family protein [Serpentinimonas sp.]
MTSPAARVRLHVAIDLQYEVAAPGADFIFNLQLAHTPQQSVVWESLQVSQPVAQVAHTDAATRARLLCLTAQPGRLQVSYRATADLHFHVAEPASVLEVPIAELAPEAIPYLYPSRYCQSDQLTALATQLFGHLPRGYLRIQAVQRWVQSQVSFQSATSNSTTSALDTLRDRVGVCRDFAHLMIAMCRALNVPARFTTATDSHRHRARCGRFVVRHHLRASHVHGAADRCIGPERCAGRLGTAGAPHAGAVHGRRQQGAIVNRTG